MRSSIAEHINITGHNIKWDHSSIWQKLFNIAKCRLHGSICTHLVFGSLDTDGILCLKINSNIADVNFFYVNGIKTFILFFFEMTQELAPIENIYLNFGTFFLVFPLIFRRG